MGVSSEAGSGTSSPRPGLIGRGVVALFDALGPRRRLVLVTAALAAAVAAIGAARIRPAADVSTVAAGGDDSSTAGGGLAEAARLLSTFGTLETLLVDVSKPGARDAELESIADDVASRLRATGQFRNVLFRVTREEQSGLMRLLFGRRFLLLPPPEDLRPGVESARRDLMLPGGTGLEELVQRDPLGHRNALRELLAASSPALQVDTSTGTLLSHDRTHALLVLDPASRALDVGLAEETLRAVRSAVPEGVEAEVFGAHVFATSAAASIRRDVWVTVGATAVLVVVLFGLVFGRPAPVLAVVLPVAMGGLFAAGVIGWAAIPIHGISLGFGAILVGIGVDYSTHLVLHVRAFRRDHPEASADLAVTEVLLRISGSIVLGAATTVAAFAALAVSGTPILGQVFTMCGLGIGGSLATCLVLLPLLGETMGVAPRRRSGETAPSQGRLGRLRPGFALGGAVVVTLLLLYGLPDVRFDGDPRRLEHQPPETQALDQRFAERWRNPRYPTLVAVRGDSVEQALRRSDRVARMLEVADERGHIGSFASLSRILPSAAAQEENRRLYRESDVEGRLRPALEGAELRPEAFEPFFHDLRAATAEGSLVPVVRPGDLAGTPLAGLVERTLAVDEGGHAHALTVVHMSGTGRKELPVSLRDALNALPGVTVVSPAGLAERGLSAIRAKVAPLSLLALLFVAILLCAYYRRVVPVLYALMPVVLAFAWSFGLMGLLDVPLDIVSIGAFAMIAGVGVDYGIFVVDGALSGEKGHLGLTRRTVGLAAATTLAGFGALLLARSPVMWSLGFAVCAGILTSLAAAVLVLPALFAFLGPAAPSCPGCGTPLPSPPLRPGLWLQLLVVAGLALWLVMAWLGGARSTGGLSVVLVAGADVAYGAWLVRRLARRKRAPCRTCPVEG